MAWRSPALFWFICPAEKKRGLTTNLKKHYINTQSQDNRARAVAWCKNALRLDVYCVEALEFLVERKLLR